MNVTDYIIYLSQENKSNEQRKIMLLCNINKKHENLRQLMSKNI